MATDKEIDDIRGKIRDSLKQLLEMPVTDWATRGSLGDINFAGALPIIGRIRDLLKMLAGFNFDYISFNRLGVLNNALQAITASFGKIRDFTLSIANPVQQRDQIVNELNGQYDSWFDAIHPIVAFAIRSTTDFEQLERELRDKVSKVENSTNETLKKQEDLLKEAETSVSAIKKAAAEAGVSQEAVYFKVQAEEHKSASRYWMLAMISTALLTMIWGAIALWFIPIRHGADNAEIVHDAIAKIIVFTALYYTLIWCARNFSAARHNYVINRHRQNSLSTFEAFAKAADSDAAIKNAVLLQATTSIFSSQASGYSPGTSDDGEAPNKIIEIIRSFTEKGK